MANEATVTSQLSIIKGKRQYQSLPASFQATVSGTKGPTPGAVTVTTAGVEISLAALDTPGLCRVQNLDTTNIVILGIRNPDQSEFYPFMDLLPEETFVFRLSRYINQELEATGTGTTGETNQLWALAENADCQLLVEAHDK